MLNYAFSDEGNQILAIVTTNLNDVRMGSNILHVDIMLPGITEKQVWNINFDYSAKSYDVEVIEKDEQPTAILN